MADTTTKILSVQLDATQAVNGILRLNDAIDANNKQMALNKQAIKDNEAEMKKAGADTQELAKKNLDLRKANEQLAAETKVLAGEKRTLQKEVQNEIKAQSQEIGSMKQLEAQLSNLKKEYKSLSEQEREFGKRGIELRNQINKTTTELKKAEYGIQEYYRNVGNYQNAILNALGINGRFGQSIMGLTNMQGGFSGAMTAMGASVKAFGASLMALLTNPVFLAIAGIAGVGMAFKWFYDYNVEVEHAMRVTREFTGVAGDELIHLRAEIEATASTYGKEYKEVLEGVDLLMSHFGLTSEEAMKTLNDGFRIGADINGNYLQLLKQYGPVLKDAGVQASQLVAMIQQTRSGIFSQQGLEAIKQASARIREMGTQTRQSLQGIGIDVDEMQNKLRNHEIEMVDAIKMVSDRLKELPDNAQEVGNVMADVFGRQGKFASQEMIESLGDIETNIDALIEKSGEYGQALDDNQKATADLEEETARLFGAGENGWETLKTRADTFWKQALANVIKKVRELLKWFAEMGRKSQLFRTAAQIIAGVIWQMTSGIIDMFRAIGAGFKAMGSWIDAFVKTFKSAFGIIKSLGQGVGDILTGNVSKGISEIEQGISKGITNALNGLKTALKDTINVGRQATRSFSNAYNVAGAFFDNYGVDDGSDSSWGDGGGYSGSDYGSDYSSNSSGGSGGKHSGSGGKKNKKSTGSKKNTGSKSSRSTGTRKAGLTPEQKAEQEAQKKLKHLIEEAEKAKMRALQERAKKEKEAVDELYEMQKAALIKKYGTLEDLEKRLDNATTDAQRNQAQAAIDGYNSLMQNLEDNRQNMYDAIDKAEEDAIKKREERQAAIAKQLAQIYLEESKEGSEAQLIWQKDLLEQEEEQELAAAVDSEELKNAIIAKYAKKREQLEKEHADKRKQAELERMNKELTAYQTYAETMLASTEEWQEKNLQYQLQVLQAQMVAELAMYENNEVMKAAIREKYAKMELDARRTHTQAVITAEQEKYNAITSMVSGLGDVIGEFGEQSKEAAILQKTLALGEVLVAQAVAIANAVKAGSNAANPWQMIAQIAASVTAVTVAMVQAFKALDQAKFATGGYIQGSGTSTSDSIPIRVSNGESIMNANTTAMFGGLLSSLNQLGGGVPIQVQQTAASVRGEDMLARAVARGVAMLPNPVVSVEDINKGQRQVQVMNERATL